MGDLYLTGGQDPLGTTTWEESLIDAGLFPETGVLGDGGRDYNTPTAPTAPTAPAYSQDDYDYYTDQIGLGDQQLIDADENQQIGYDAADSTYTTDYNKATGVRGDQIEDFNVVDADSKAGKNKALGKVDDSAYSLANMLRRVIGAASGSGSSAYQINAPQAVSNISDEQRTGVLESFGRNERNLATSRQRATTAFEQLLQDLLTNKSMSKASTQASVLGNKQGIWESQANMAGDQAKLIGGDYSAIQAVQQPYLDKIQGATDTIQGLPANYLNQKPTQAVKVNTPKLSDYTVDRPSVNVERQSGGATSSPYSYFLKKKFSEG